MLLVDFHVKNYISGRLRRRRAVEIQIQLSLPPLQVLIVQIDHRGRVGVAEGGGCRLWLLAAVEADQLMVKPVSGVYRLHRRIVGDHLPRRREATAGIREVQIQKGWVGRGSWPLAGRLDGAAQAGAVAAGASLTEDETLDIDPGRRDGEVSLGLGAAELHRLGIIRPRGLLGRVERPEPHAAPLAGVPDLRCKAAPRPLPHSPVPHLLWLSRAAVGPTCLHLRPACRLAPRQCPYGFFYFSFLLL